MRNVFMKAVFGVALVALLTLASCAKQRGADGPDYSKQIAALEKSVADITKKLNEGKLIKDVKVDGNKLTIELSDGTSKTFESAGGSTASATKLEISEDGFWIIDGKKRTDLPAKGKDGKIYEPDDDGFWYEIVDGKRTNTNKKWLHPDVLTAKLENGVLTLYNVKGGPEEGLVLGADNINDLTFIPTNRHTNANNTNQNPIIVLEPMKFGASTFVPTPNEDECAAPVNNTCPAFYAMGKTILSYRVSPASVSEAMIKTDELAFQHHKSTLRSSDEQFKAKFISLEKGILKVQVIYDANKLDKNTAVKNIRTAGAEGDKLQELSLIVPLKNGQVVYSNAFDKVVRADRQFTDYVGWSVRGKEDVQRLATTVNDAKQLDTYGINYKEDTDLSKIVALIFDRQRLNLEDYNLSFSYDLLDENGKEYVYDLQGVGDTRATDQQKFLKIEGSKVTPQSLDGAKYNKSTIGRTPIVRVLVNYTGEGYQCNPVGMFFIKLKIEEITTPETFVVSVESEQPIRNLCEPFVLNYGTPALHKGIYDKLNISAEAFHNLYTFEPNDSERDNTNTKNIVEGIGNVVAENPDQAVIPQGTYNLKWSVPNALLSPAVAGKTISKTVYYKSVDGKTVTITFSAKVESPALNINSIIHSPAWTPDGEGVKNREFIKHTPYVPGDTSVTEAKYPANAVQAAFKLTQANGTLANIKYPAELGTVTSEFVFVVNKKQTLTTTTADGKKRVLSLKQEAIANGTSLAVVETINGVETTPAEPAFVELNKTTGALTVKLGDLNGSDRLVPLAEEWLNSDKDALKVRVAMSAKTCQSVPVQISGFAYGCNNEQFDIVYLRPITFTTKVTDQAFYHNVDADYEGNTISVAELLKLTDWKGDKFKNNYFAFYGIKSVKLDVANYKTIPAMTQGTITLTHTGSATPVVNADGLGKLSYKHNNVSMSTFTIEIPIEITYKHGTIKDTLKIPVKPRPAE